MVLKAKFSVQQIEINPRDVEILHGSLEKIKDLISIHPFSRKINFLFENRHLSLKPVKNRYNLVKSPNCIGTAFFVASVSQLNYPYCAFENELDPHMKNPVCQEDILPGVFNFSYSAEHDDWHAGIYLGKLSNNLLFFAQSGVGRNFCIETIMNYESPRFYVPRSLL